MDAERWLSLKDLAAHFGRSTRWLEYRLREGMPSAVIAGRRKCRQSEVERWLEIHGHLRKERTA
jgi:hypothetical protein